jgi:predicted ATPase
MDVCLTRGGMSEAVAVGLEHLQYVGVAWTAHPADEEVRREYQLIWSKLGGRAIEELVDLPLMTDPASLALLDVLTKLGPPAVFTDVNLYSLTACRGVNLSLERGNSDGSSSAFVRVGMVAGPFFGDYKAGYRFGQVGYDLVERRDLKHFRARIFMNFGNQVMPWTRHARSGRDLLHRAFDVANKTGDLTYAVYSRAHLNSNMLMVGDPLDEVQREAEQGLALAQQMQFGIVIDIIATQLALVQMLRGSTRRFGSFDDEQFDDVRVRSRLSSNPNLALATCW